MLRVIGFIATVIGSGLVVWSIFLPVNVYTGAFKGSFSIYNYAFPKGNSTTGAFWFAAEPAGVALLALLAAVLVLVAGRAGTLSWLGAGILGAFGIQTFLLYAGYAFTSNPVQHEHSGSGGVVGIVAALVLIAAAVVAAVAAAQSQRGSAANPVRAPG